MRSRTLTWSHFLRRMRPMGVIHRVLVIINGRLGLRIRGRITRSIRWQWWKLVEGRMLTWRDSHRWTLWRRIWSTTDTQIWCSSKIRAPWIWSLTLARTVELAKCLRIVNRGTGPSLRINQQPCIKVKKTWSKSYTDLCQKCISPPFLDFLSGRLCLTMDISLQQIKTNSRMPLEPWARTLTPTTWWAPCNTRPTNLYSRSRPCSTGAQGPTVILTLEMLWIKPGVNNSPVLLLIVSWTASRICNPTDNLQTRRRWVK